MAANLFEIININRYPSSVPCLSLSLPLSLHLAVVLSVRLPIHIIYRQLLYLLIGFIFIHSTTPNAVDYYSISESPTVLLIFPYYIHLRRERIGGAGELLPGIQ